MIKSEINILGNKVSKARLKPYIRPYNDIINTKHINADVLYRILKSCSLKNK